MEKSIAVNQVKKSTPHGSHKLLKKIVICFSTHHFYIGFNGLSYLEIHELVCIQANYWPFASINTYQPFASMN